MKKALCALLVLCLAFMATAEAETSPTYVITPSVEKLTVTSLQSEYVTFSVVTSKRGSYSISYDIADKTKCRASWGEWDGNQIPLKVKGYGAGETTITISIYDENDVKVDDSDYVLNIEVLPSPLNLVNGDEVYEVREIYMSTYQENRVPWISIAYSFKNNGSDPSYQSVAFDVYQNGHECSSPTWKTNEQNTYEKIKDGASLYVIRCYATSNRTDIIDISMHHIWSWNNKTDTIYFDPVTGEVRNTKEELLEYREAHPTPEPTATPEPTPVPTPTEVPTPAVVTVDPSQGATLEKMFATDPSGYKVSYGKWQAKYEFILMTYEFFSDGTMTMTLGSEYSTGTTFPGLYQIKGTSMEMYAVGQGGSISYQRVDISYDGEKLIIDGAECYPVE